MIEVVPVAQEMEKKLNGTRPQSTKAGKCFDEGSANTFVKTNVSTPIMTRGLASDHPSPRLMLR